MESLRKRATDDQTAGGNAYSGSSGNTGSGNIVNVVDDDGTITNTGPGTSECFAHLSTLHSLITTLRLRRHRWGFDNR